MARLEFWISVLWSGKGHVSGIDPDLEYVRGISLIKNAVLHRIVKKNSAKYKSYYSLSVSS